jgi:hypothetical protein
VNALPSYGFVDVHIKSEARLGQSLLDSADQSTSFLVLRWKEPLAFVLALTIVWVLMWSTRRVKTEKDSATSNNSGDPERVLSERG